MRGGALRKRFAIKDNGICNRSVRGLMAMLKSFTAFFPLRTMRVVTRMANLSMSSFWIADKPTEPLLSLPRSPFLVSGLPTIREFMAISPFHGTYPVSSNLTSGGRQF